MLMIPCPWCGPRDETEFVYGGPKGADRPDPAQCTDEVWLDYLLNVPNPVGPGVAQPPTVFGGWRKV